MDTHRSRVGRRAAHRSAFDWLVVLSLAFAPTTTWSDTLGGDDKFVVSNPEIPSFSAVSMDIAQNGDIYLAVEIDDPTEGPRIRVYRSKDGGDSWSLWGTLSESDGLSSTGYSQPSLRVAEGTQNRCYLACRSVGFVTGTDIVVAYSALNLASASFTAVHAMSVNAVDFGRPQLTSDAIETSGYRLMLVAEGDDGDGTDVWFARSTTFGATWDAQYEIGSVSGTTLDYSQPRIAYGTGGFIHCSWTLLTTAAGQDNAVRYRRASNYAGAGIADWAGILGLTTTLDGVEDVGARVAAAHTGGTVVVNYRSANTGTVLVSTSTNSGASWTAQPSIGTVGGFGLMAYPAAGPHGFAMLGLSLDQVVLRTAELATPQTWTLAEAFTDRPYPDDAGGDYAFVTDPTRGNRIAVAWHPFHLTTTDSVMFDAEWRDDPGYPNDSGRFPLALPSGAGSAPALANLDDDSGLEIVFIDAAGNVRVYDPDSFPVAGWPKSVGAVALHAAVAVGDLDGDGENDVVAGGPTGRVNAFHHDGTVVSGFPVVLGTGKQVFVSLGRLSPAPVHQIVARSGDKLFVLQANGTELAGFPVTTPLAVDAIAPAAIGDLDGDGHREIVTGSGSQCLVYQDTGGSPFIINVAGQTVSDAPTLADVDLNGTLEIAFPTVQGKMYIFSNTGVTRPGWPISDPTATPVTSAAFGNVAGLGEPEVTWANENDSVYLRDRNGINYSGWPHATTSGQHLHGAPIIETLDNLAPDILIGAPDLIWAWHNFDTNVNGWPKDVPGAITVSPASGDIDADGKVEVVFVTSTHLVVLDTNGNIDRADPRGQWPMYGYNSQRSGCLACDADAVTGVTGEATAGRLEFAPPSPNPSRGALRFQFRLPDRADVRLELYDIAGREVRRLVLGSLEAGSHETQWDGRGTAGARLRAGIYHARLVTTGAKPESAARRIVLIP